jgi:hypothetical protein
MMVVSEGSSWSGPWVEELESPGRSTLSLDIATVVDRDVQLVASLYAHLVPSTWWTYSWVAISSIVDWHGTPAI